MKKFFITLMCIVMVVCFMPTVALAGGATTATYGWYQNAESNTTEYTLTSVSDLLGFANIVNGTNLPEGIVKSDFKGKTVKLGADIDLQGTADNPWTPINGFNGTFDGGYEENTVTKTHIISNLYVHSTDTSGVGFGLFGTSNGAVKNLTIKDAHVKGNSACGAFVGKGNGKLENLHLTGTISIGTTTSQGHLANYNSSYIGGIRGNSFRGKIANCTVDGGEGSVIGGGRQVGGILGFDSYGFTDSVVSCTVKNVKVIGGKSVGGIVGWANSTGIMNCSIANVHVELTNAGEPNTIGLISGTSRCLINDTETTVYENNTADTSSTLTVNGETPSFDSNPVLRLYSPYSSASYVTLAEGKYMFTCYDITKAMTKGDYITLLEDSDPATIPANRNIIIDLNGYSIAGDFDTPAVINKGTLTLKNGTVIGELSGENIKPLNVTTKEPTCIAKIGDVKYGSLGKAIAAANNNDVIKMMQNTEETIEITNGKILTIDLNGCKLSGTQSWTIDNYGVLTIQDTLGGGEVSGITYGVYNNGSDDVLNISSGKVTAGNYAVYNKEGTVNVSGTATLQSTESAENKYGVAVFNTGGGTAIISGGVLLCVNDGYSYHAPVYGGTNSITGGTFSSDVSQYILDNYVEYAMRNGTYIVKASGVEKPAFTTGNYWSDLVGKVYTEMYSAPYVPSTPSTPTDNVTNSGSTTTDNATTSADLSGSTSTSNGTTSATVDKTTADKIVDKAVENKSKEVVIDATANTTTAANSTTIAQVTIPTETLGAIAEKTEADVTVKTDVVEVKLDNTAAGAVAAQATGDTVQIIAEKVKEDATEVHFELKVVCSNGTVISDFKGGNVAVTVTLPKEMADKKVVCVYIDDSGHMSKVEGQKNADGTYTFFTGHFSTYAILAEEEADAAIAEQTEAIKNIEIKLTSKQVKTKSGKKGIKITWTAAAGDKTLDGVEVFRSKEKNKGYGTKAFFTSTKGGNKGSYINTKSLKKGTRYYYKVRGYVLVNGEKVYTDYSTKAWRTVK